MSGTRDESRNQPELDHEDDTNQLRERDGETGPKAEDRTQPERDPAREMAQFAKIYAVGAARSLLRRRAQPGDTESQPTVGGSTSQAHSRRAGLKSQ